MAVNLYVCLFVAMSLSPAITGLGSLVGGYRSRNTTDPAIKNVTKFAVDTYNEQSNDVHFFNLIRIVSAETQVVAGTNYKLDVEIGKTPCRKNRANDIQSCDGDDTNVLQVFSCTFEVYQSLPPQSYSFKKQDCKPKDSTENIEY